MDWEFLDSRLEKRAQLCFERIQKNPEFSFPRIFADPGELLGFYRLINNERLEYGAILDTFLDDTKTRANGHKDVLILHDTTIVAPSRKVVKGLGPIYKKASSLGFLSHLSLAVASDGPRVILGPCGLYNWTRNKKKSKNEHLRWFNQVQESEGCISSHQAIHIMDREGDSYYNLCQLQSKGYRFVIRSCHDRKLLTGGKLSDFIEKVPMIADKTVSVGARKTSPFEKGRTIHPPRESRIAELQIAAGTVEIPNTRYGGETKSLPSTVKLNVVTLLEVAPPKGQKAIEWTLLTSEPIHTKAQVLKIIDSYKRRWLIEEFFKTLKTGCRLEERLMESDKAWYNVLTLFLGIATHILNLRVTDDKKINSKDHVPFSDGEFAILKVQAKRHHLPLKSLNDALLVIGKMGGHIIYKKHPPGWRVLCQGYETLLSMVEGYNAYHIS